MVFLSFFLPSCINQPYDDDDDDDDGLVAAAAMSFPSSINQSSDDVVDAAEVAEAAFSATPIK